jgi:hypothetical protein
MRIIVGIDFDGIIADTYALKAQWIKDHVGKDIPPWQCDRTSCVPLIGAKAYAEMGKYVYGSQATAQTRLVEGVAEVLKAVSALTCIYVITNRNAVQAQYAQQWLEEQGLAGSVQEIISSAGRDKVVVCVQKGVEWFMDDDMRHLKPVLRHQMKLGSTSLCE